VAVKLAVFAVLYDAITLRVVLVGTCPRSENLLPLGFCGPLFRQQQQQQQQQLRGGYNSERSGGSAFGGVSVPGCAAA
jgi:hypothetical protein